MKLLFLLWLSGTFSVQATPSPKSLLEKYDTSIQIDTAFFTEGFAKASALENVGAYNEAILAFEQLKEAAQQQEAHDYHLLALAGMGRNHYNRSGYDEAIIHLEEGLTLAQQYPEEIQDKSLASVYISLGACYGDLGDVEKEMDYLNQALVILIKDEKKNAFELATCYNDMGLCYGVKRNFEKELSYLQKALALYLQTVGEQHGETANCYSNMSLCYRNLGDYHKQLEYAQKSLNIRLAVLPEGHPYIAISYNSIGQYYGYMGEYEKQVAYIKKALEIVINAFGKSHVAVATFSHNLGKAYAQLGNYDESLLYFQQAMEIWMHLFGEDNPYVASTYLQIAASYGMGENYEQQLYYLQKALALHEKVLSQHDPTIAINYDDLGIYHEQKHDYEAALSYFQKALIALSDNFDITDPYTNPGLDNVYLKKLLLEVLSNKGRVLEKVYKTTGEIKTLRFALTTMHTTLNLVDTLRFEYTDPESRQFLEEKANDMYGRAVHIAYQLNNITQNPEYLQTAFMFAEKSKANALIQSLNNLRAKNFANVPDSLIQQENNLKADIAYYDKQLFEATQQHDSANMRTYQDYLFDTKTQYNQFIGHLEKEYPKYYQLKYDMRIHSLEEVQQQLAGKDEMLISYFANDASVFAFGITQDTVIFKEIPHGGKLKDWVADYRKSITDYSFFTNYTEEAEALYSQAAYQLYNLLLAPVLSNIPEKPANIAIIPDREIWAVNFDVLLPTPHQNQEAGWDKNLPYLIHNYVFSYNYSATLNTLHQTDKNTIAFAGFAPSYTNYDISKIDTVLQKEVPVLTRSGNLPLPGAEEEIKLLASLMEGDLWTGAAASEANFKKYAKDYDILHLAMHAQVSPHSPKYSCFLFAQEDSSKEDGVLDAAEIYAMELHAKMGVLSACNSGLGEISSGTGMSSLAQAFAYAGCPSLVMSTWEVPDASTQKVMVAFYENLQQGQSKNKALRHAKLSFLKTTDDQVALHPYNWAGLSLLGDPTPIHHKIPFIRYPALILLTLIILISVVLLLRNRKRLVER